MLKIYYAYAQVKQLSKNSAMREPHMLTIAKHFLTITQLRAPRHRPQQGTQRTTQEVSAMGIKVYFIFWLFKPPQSCASQVMHAGLPNKKNDLGERASE